MSVRSLIAVLAFAWSAAAFAAQAPESVVQEFLTLAYNGRFDALPVAQAVRMEGFEKRLRNTLRVRCVRVEDATLTVHPLTDGPVTVDADVVIAKSDPRGPAGWFAVDDVHLRFELVREGDRLRIREVRDRDDDLAEALLRSDANESQRMLAEHPERLTKGLARALYAQAATLVTAMKMEQAAAAAEMARVVAIAAGDRGGEALARSAASCTWQPIDTALQFTAESMAIAETTGDADVLARVFYDRGRALRFSKTPTAIDESIAWYEKAMPLAARAEDPTLRVRILYSLANVHATGRNDSVAARRYADEGMAAAIEAGDAFGQMALESVLTAVYVNQGDRERGLFHHERALAIAEHIQAAAYPSLLVRSADLLASAGRFEEAKAVIARVLTRTGSGMQPRIGTLLESHYAKALRILATAEAESGNLQEARCLVREAWTQSPNRYLFELAPYYLKADDAATALALALTSLADPRDDPIHFGNALIAAGRAYRKLGNVERGLEVALEAIAIREDLNTRVAGDEQQRAYASIASAECYELAAELAIDKGDPLHALTFLERGRGTVLTDILANGRSAIESDGAMREREAALAREVARVSLELDRARSANDERAVKDLSAELDRVRAVRASFADGVRTRSERREAARREVDPTRLREVVKRLPPRTVAIEYNIGEAELHAFVISRDVSGEPRIVVRTVAAPRETVERKVNVFVAMLSANNLRVKSAGRELYELLVTPIENEISGAEALLVIPDEMLWRVPFAALVDGRNRYLAERTAVLYAPSLTAFATIVDASRKRRPQPASLLAVGNPLLDVASRNMAASFYRGVELAPLPDAEHEVDALRTLYDARRSLVLKRDRATESRTKTALRDATIAHLATHAILDDANPMYSRLMLSRDEDAHEDGWLESWEVARLDLHADLVVLSACDTARGRIGGGEGVVGLSWSFFIAGARATVATQWKVASASTAELMIAFHRALRAPAKNPALHKAHALREAQLHLMRNPKTRHPFHWAAFVLMGDPSAAGDS